MKGVKLDHVACAVKKIENCFGLLKKLSGIPLKGGQNSEFRGGQWLTMNSAKLELIEPVGDDHDNNFLHKFLNKRGPGIHHITFTVPSLAEAIKRAKKLNFQVLDIDETKPHWKEAFLHPKQTMNMLIQLAEHNPSLAKPGEAWDGRWSGFQGYPPKGATEDFRIKGLSGVNLLTKQENLDLAQSVFCDLLGGEMHQPSTFPQLVPSRFYVFTWPESPLSVAINIELYKDQKAKEGPLGIEMLVSRDYSDRSIIDPDLGAILIPLVKNSTL